jgi:hypothetical protein
MTAKRPWNLALALGAACVVVQCSTDSSSGPDETPRSFAEACSDTLAINDTIVGTLSSDGHPLTCLFTARHGQDLIAHVQGTGGQRTGAINLRVIDGTFHFGRDLGLTFNAGDSSDLEASSTGRFSIPRDTSYLLTVNAVTTSPPPKGGPFRALLREIDHRPEVLPETLTTLGDTVSAERIDYVGDIDEFVVVTDPDDTVNVFFQTLEGGDRADLGLEIAAEGDGSRWVTGAHPDSSFSSRATGNIRAHTGQMRMTVRGLGDGTNGDRGPYRFWIWRVAAEPESLSSSYALGDSLWGERIDRPGDVDNFFFSVPESTLTNFFQLEEPPGIVRAQIIDRDSGTPLYDFFQFWQTSSRTIIPPGNFVLSVRGDASTGDGYHGPYRIHTAVLDDAPENVSASVVVGETVSGEAVDPEGDLDVFTLTAPARGPVTLALQGLGTSETVGFTGYIRRPGEQSWLLWVCGLGMSPKLTSRQTGPFDLEAGTYELAVSGDKDGSVLGERGPYRVAVLPWPTTPEIARSLVAVGDTVDSETINRRGDIDQFVVQTTPGQELQVFFESQKDGLEIRALDPTTGAVLRGTPATAYTGRFSTPNAGEVLLTVSEARADDGCLVEQRYHIGGADYAFNVIAIDRMPESTASLIAVDDTVDTEVIDVVGDIDEFEFDGAANGTVEVYLQTPQGFWGADLLLEVLPPASDSALGSVTSHMSTPNLEDNTTGAFDLPVSGRYVIRVQSADDRNGVGAYRFRVVGR